jgi:hypothetical protein
MWRINIEIWPGDAMLLKVLAGQTR